VQPLSVFLERGAAPGAVGHDGLDLVQQRLEQRDILARHLARKVQHGLVVVRRAATCLPARGDYIAARAAQHAHGRAADVRHGDVHHAAEEEGNPVALRASSGFDEGQLVRQRLARPRCELDEVYQPAARTGHMAEHRRSQPVEPERLHEAQRSGNNRGPLRAGQDVAQHELDEEGPRVFVFDGDAAAHDQLADAHAGRADGVARAAVEAVIEVILHPIGHRQLAVLDCPQQAQPPARGEHLELGLLVRGAHGQAAPAPDAPLELIIIRQVQAENLLAGCGFV